MIVEVGSSVARLLAVGRFLLLALATLVIAHDAVYLQSHGPAAADALDRLGHAAHRPFLVMAAASAVIALTVWGAVQLAILTSRLRRARSVRRIDAMPATSKRPERPDLRYRTTLLRLWALQALVVIPAFALQENLEHGAVEGAFPGLGIFTGAHCGSLPTLVGVIGVVSSVGALLRWQIARFTHRLVSAAPGDRLVTAPASPPARSATIAGLLARHRWLLARRTPGRAPPILFA